jgi:hypothetical protein
MACPPDADPVRPAISVTATAADQRIARQRRQAVHRGAERR